MSAPRACRRIRHLTTKVLEGRVTLSADQGGVRTVDRNVRSMLVATSLLGIPAKASTPVRRRPRHHPSTKLSN